jgi:SecD/SecF fusion protein
VDQEILGILFTNLQKYLPDGTTMEDFVPGGTNDDIGVLKYRKVGPTIADDIKKNAVWAVIGSLAVVFLYILLRFRRWQFSLGAVAAVFHDVLIVLGVFSATSTLMPFSMEIDQAFIAAILTVIGYSLNDTVVVFDRIREIINEKGWKSGENVNLALNSTLSRTLNTSLTTLVVLLSIFIFGGETLRGFMFAMIVGVIVGTYSSLFIATPIMFDTLARKLAKGKA